MGNKMYSQINDVLSCLEMLEQSKVIHINPYIKKHSDQLVLACISSYMKRYAGQFVNREKFMELRKDRGEFYRDIGRVYRYVNELRNSHVLKTNNKFEERIKKGKGLVYAYIKTRMEGGEMNDVSREEFMRMYRKRKN